MSRPRARPFACRPATSALRVLCVRALNPVNLRASSVLVLRYFPHFRVASIIVDRRPHLRAAGPFSFSATGEGHARPNHLSSVFFASRSDVEFFFYFNASSCISSLPLPLDCSKSFYGLRFLARSEHAFSDTEPSMLCIVHSFCLCCIYFIYIFSSFLVFSTSSVFHFRSN